MLKDDSSTKGVLRRDSSSEARTCCSNCIPERPGIIMDATTRSVGRADSFKYTSASVAELKHWAIQPSSSLNRNGTDETLEKRGNVTYQSLASSLSTAESFSIHTMVRVFFLLLRVKSPDAKRDVRRKPGSSSAGTHLAGSCAWSGQGWAHRALRPTIASLIHLSVGLRGEKKEDRRKRSITRPPSRGHSRLASTYFLRWSAPTACPTCP